MNQQLPAQTQHADSSAGAKTSYWQADLGYLSNSVYLGRKDSVRLPYLTPSVSYHNKSGLYMSGGLWYLPAAGDHRIDMGYVEAGYSFSVHQFEAQVSATKYFYSEESTNVNANVKAGLDLYTAYDWDFLTPSAELTLNFSKQTDYILTLGLEHSFYAGDHITITPSVFMNAGTQNAYNSYYQERKFAAVRKKAKARNMPYVIGSNVQNAAAYKTLDYEGSLPINYTLHRFTFNITPTVALPVNPANIQYTVKSPTGNVHTTTYREAIQNSFYWSTGVTFTF